MSSAMFGLTLALAITWICFVLVAWWLSLRITDARRTADAAQWVAQQYLAEKLAQLKSEYVVVSLNEQRPKQPAEDLKAHRQRERELEEELRKVHKQLSQIRTRHD